MGQRVADPLVAGVRQRVASGGIVIARAFLEAVVGDARLAGGERRQRGFDALDEAGIFGRAQRQRAVVFGRRGAHVMAHADEPLAATQSDPQRGGGFEVAPGRGAEENLLLAPADRDMRGQLPVGARQARGRKGRAPVLHRGDHGHHDAGVDAVGFHHDGDALGRFGPVRIARQAAADPCREQEQRERGAGQGEQPCKPAPPA